MIADLIRKGLEKRWTLANPPEEILELLGGNATHSGERVSPSRALELPAYLAAIRAISEDVAKLPLKLYGRLEPRGKVEKPKHWLYNLMHSSPNPNMTSITFRQTLTQWALGWGNGYAYIDWGNDFAETTLWPMSPDRVTPRQDRTGLIYYECILDSGKRQYIAREDVLHIPGFGWNGLQGYSLANLARETVGLGMALQTAGASFFGNGSMPGGVAEYPGQMNDEAFNKFRQRWQDMHGGPSRVNKLAILEHGMTYKPVSIPNRDAQWIESGKFSVEQICRIARIPQHKVQHLDHATFSNITEQSIEYVTDTLMPWLIRWEQELVRKLCFQHNAGLFYEHVVDGLLRGAPKERNEAYQIMRRNGVLSANDWREKENLNPIGEQGDVYIVEANMVGLEAFLEITTPGTGITKAEPKPEPQSTKQDERGELRQRAQNVATTYSPLLRQAYGRILTLEADKLKRKARDTRRPNDWLDGFYRDHCLHIRMTLSGLIEAMSRALWNLGAESTEFPEEECIVWLQTMAERHVSRSRQELQGAALQDVTARWLVDVGQDNGRLQDVATDEIARLVDRILELQTERKGIRDGAVYN